MINMDATHSFSSNKGLEIIAFDSGYCPFANHHRTPFTVKNVEYRSVQQYVAAKKAEHFCDLRRFNQIMASNSAKEIRLVSDELPSDEEWRRIEEDHMWVGISAKIDANRPIRKALRSTGDAVIAFCTKYDSNLGTGCAIDSDAAKDLNQWGRNLVGSLLMEKRRKL